MIPEQLFKDFQQGELLTIEKMEFQLSVENWELQETSAQNMSKRALRVVKDGLKGSNYSLGSSPENLSRLLEGARESVSYGSRSWFDFSGAVLQKDDEMEEEVFHGVSPQEIFSFLRSFMDAIGEQQLNLNVKLGKEFTRYRIETTRGGDLREGVVNFYLFFSSPIPGGGSEIFRGVFSPQFFTQIPGDEVQSFLQDYENCQRVSVPRSGRLPVIFSPRTLYFLPFCLQEGLSGQNIYRKTSPLQGKLGEEIISRQLTLMDDPQLATAPQRRSFDDEGIPTTRKSLVEKGILKDFIYDQEYAARLGKKPSGNGMKHGLFGGDIDSPITPSLVNPVLQTGDSSREEMVQDLEEGILVEQIIGFHSSNYSQGHFSVQAHGFHIQKGEVQGRLEDVMIAGNIYEDFKRVGKVGRNLHFSLFGLAPYILVDGVSVTGK